MKETRITTHHDGHGLNESIIITRDERDPDAGGASHRYTLEFNAMTDGLYEVGRLQFQHGPRNEPGSTPGLTDQAVLAVLIDRHEGFQAGPFACSENEHTMHHLREALRSLKERADERASRNVLGKNEA